jgi:PAS domain S-box-containing protein
MFKSVQNYILIFFIICQTLAIGHLYAQEGDRDKAMWIVQNFSPNVEWIDEASFKTYVIGVYGPSNQIYNELTELSKIKQIKGKSFSVVQFRKVRELTPVQILYVDTFSNYDMRSIFEKLPSNTLLITDQSPYPEYSMINMLSLKQSRKKFEINQKNAIDAGLSFNKNILVHGGSEVILKEMYAKTEKELAKERKKLEIQRAELASLTIELEKLKNNNQRERIENERQKQINKQQKIEIESQQKEMEVQHLLLDSVQRNLSIQQEKLNFNKKVLESQEGKIDIQKLEVDKRNEKIQSQISEIEKNKKLLKTKDTVLSEQSSTIRLRNMVLILFVVFVVFILILLFFIWRGYKIKQKINEELRDKNIAISQQKEEISNQQYQTELLNKELEKLSIVAARTDNAVTIMDKEGNFEWVNVGFTRLYGYTLQLLTHELDENIKGVSSNLEIGNIIEQCITNKKTIVYESRNLTRNGSEIWVQTSLTPILNAQGEISKLITIETDISKIKKAENEIRKQHEKILEQTIELEATNKELEKLSLVASETDNAIAIMDSAGNYQWINEGFSRMFGYSYNQLIAEYSGNIITKETSLNIRNLIKTCIEDCVPSTYELLQKTREAKDVWAQTTLTPITDKENNIKNLISISIDITQLKKAEQEIRQQSEELLTQKEELILQKDRIELQNQNIKASIAYAKTIQNAILPLPTSLNNNFNAFIIYKPKDIVSGDFYWYTRLPATQDKRDRYFYAAVDCTGHGVPGAFMSMIGSRLLNEIVNEKKIDKPSKILEIMNSEIKTILRQDVTDNNDGMDVCLCALEPVFNGTTKVTFAGAKRPLYYYKQDEQALKYIKGTRKTIGGTHAKRNTEVFVDHEVLLEKGDILYLSTDGIVDQPSPDRIRFGSLRFINLLKDIAEKPLENQKMAIEQAVLDFQEYEQQRDDVTFLGIKV